MLYFVSECSAEYPCISWVTIAMSRHKENYPNKQKEGQMTSRDKTRRRTEWISFQSLLPSVRHLDSWLLKLERALGGGGYPQMPTQKEKQGDKASCLQERQRDRHGKCCFKIDGRLFLGAIRVDISKDTQIWSWTRYWGG